MEKNNFKYFKFIAVGFLFCIVNIRILGIDILSNLIGFIFLFIGFKNLRELNKNFNYIFVLIILGTPIFLLSTYLPTNRVDTAMFRYYNDFTNYGIDFLYNAMMINIGNEFFKTVKKEANKYGNSVLEMEAFETWKLYAAVLVSYFSIHFTYTMGAFSEFYAILMSMATIYGAIKVFRFIISSGELWK